MNISANSLDIANLYLQLKDIGCVKMPLNLSCIPHKRDLYSIDPYFREGWEHVQQHVGNNALELLNHHACIIFKPDAIVGRRIQLALELLLEYGYKAIGFSIFMYNRQIIREDWRYQYNIATSDRIRVIDELLSLSPSLLVLLRYDNASNIETASSRLKKLKGPSQPHLRNKTHLRYRLGVVSTFINFIHTTDESIDIPRNLALYFDNNVREQLILSMLYSSDCWNPLQQQIKTLYAAYPQHDLLFEDSVKRIKLTIDSHDKFQKLTKISTEMNSKDFTLHNLGKWEEFFHLIESEGILIDEWDKIIIKTKVVIPNLSTGKAIIS